MFAYLLSFADSFIVHVTSLLSPFQTGSVHRLFLENKILLFLTPRSPYIRKAIRTKIVSQSLMSFSEYRERGRAQESPSIDTGEAVPIMRYWLMPTQPPRIKKSDKYLVFAF